VYFALGATRELLRPLLPVLAHFHGINHPETTHNQTTDADILNTNFKTAAVHFSQHRGICKIHEFDLPPLILALCDKTLPI